MQRVVTQASSAPITEGPAQNLQGVDRGYSSGLTHQNPTLASVSAAAQGRFDPQSRPGRQPNTSRLARLVCRTPNSQQDSRPSRITKVCRCMKKIFGCFSARTRVRSSRPAMESGGTLNPKRATNRVILQEAKQLEDDILTLNNCPENITEKRLLAIIKKCKNQDKKYDPLREALEKVIVNMAGATHPYKGTLVLILVNGISENTALIPMVKNILKNSGLKIDHTICRIIIEHIRDEQDPAIREQLIDLLKISETPAEKKRVAYYIIVHLFTVRTPSNIVEATYSLLETSLSLDFNLTTIPQYSLVDNFISLLSTHANGGQRFNTIVKRFQAKILSDEVLTPIQKIDLVAALHRSFKARITQEQASNNQRVNELREKEPSHWTTDEVDFANSLLPKEKQQPIAPHFKLIPRVLEMKIKQAAIELQEALKDETIEKKHPLEKHCATLEENMILTIKDTNSFGMPTRGIAPTAVCIKKNPLEAIKIFNQMAKDVHKQSRVTVYFIDHELQVQKGLDAGGLKRQYITHAFNSEKLKTDLGISDDNLPCELPLDSQEDDTKTLYEGYKELGKFYSQALNEPDRDFMTGELFDPKVFDAIKNVEARHLEMEVSDLSDHRLVKIATPLFAPEQQDLLNCLKPSRQFTQDHSKFFRYPQRVSASEDHAKLILQKLYKIPSPENSNGTETNKDALVDALDQIGFDFENRDSKSYEELYNEIITNAAHQQKLLTHLREKVQRKVMPIHIMAKEIKPVISVVDTFKDRFIHMNSKLQGGFDRKEIAQNIKTDGISFEQENTGLQRQKLEWIQELFRDTSVSDDDIRTVLEFITSSRAGSPKITVRFTSTTLPPFKASTCFDRLYVGTTSYENYNDFKNELIAYAKAGVAQGFGLE